MSPGGGAALCLRAAVFGGASAVVSRVPLVGTVTADDPAIRTVTMVGLSYTGVRGRGPTAGTDDSVLPAVTVSAQRADLAVPDDVLR